MKSEQARRIQTELEAAIRQRGIHSTDAVTRRLFELQMAFGWVAEQLRLEESRNKKP